jgi:hypothetical protein
VILLSHEGAAFSLRLAAGVSLRPAALSRVLNKFTLRPPPPPTNRRDYHHYQGSLCRIAFSLAPSAMEVPLGAKLNFKTVSSYIVRSAGLQQTA